jgi:hypothetical protein
VPAFPVLFSSQSARRESRLGRRQSLSVGVCRRVSTTIASFHRGSGSSPASLRFFYSVLSLILLGKWAISKDEK